MLLTFEKNTPKQKMETFDVMFRQVQAIRRNLEDDPIIVAIDLETTGFNYGTEVIEIGAAKINLETGKVCDTFQTFVRPASFQNRAVRLPHDIINITGITNDMVEKYGIPPVKAVDALARFVDGHNLLFHNGNFDWNRFIYPSFLEYGLEHYKARIDTMTLAAGIIRFTHKDFNKKLSSLCERYGVVQKNSHRADDDSSCTAQVFYKMFIGELLDMEKDQEEKEQRYASIQHPAYTSFGSSFASNAATRSATATARRTMILTRDTLLGPVRAALWEKGNMSRVYFNFPTLTVFYDAVKDLWASKEDIYDDNRLNFVVNEILWAYGVMSGRELYDLIRSN